MSEAWHASFVHYYFQKGKRYAFHTGHPETGGLAGFRAINVDADRMEVQLDSGDKELLHMHWGPKRGRRLATFAYVYRHNQVLWHHIGGVEQWYHGKVVDELKHVAPLPTTLLPLIANYVITAE